MKSKYFSIIGAAALATAFTPLALPPVAHALSTEVEPKEEDVQILTRGPVHEAFAQVVSEKPDPGFIVSKAPPGAIEELPPEKQLEGDNVTWISGYWAWDDDTSDFLWISGVWRNIPPGRQWVPGYWNDLGDGRWQWTSGYWADAGLTEVDYVDEAPPESLDSGPNIEAPDDDSTWIPGNWRYVDTRYVWSPGYYTPLRPNWTWVPSSWNWTPRGYCYNDGYWDYSVANRGVLFAPAYFHRPVWSTPGYYYTPSVVISLGVFDNHCWVRPRFGHYYYGDYYGPRYSDLGFFVSHRWHGRRGCYDPIWAYNRWHHRHDHGWAGRVRDRFDFFRNNAEARPFRTWAAMRDFRRDRFSENEFSRSRLFASTLDGFANNPVRGERFRQLNREGRDQLVAQRQRVREFTQQRRQLETARVNRSDRTAAGARADRLAVQRERLSRSPVAGRAVNQIARNQAPPQRPQAARGAGRVRPDAVVSPNNNSTAGRNRAGLAARQNNDRVQRTRDALAGRIPGTGAKRLSPQINRNPGSGSGTSANRNRLTPQTTRDATRQGAQNATPRRTPQIGPERQRQVQPRQSVQPQRRPQVTPQQRQVQPRQSVQPQRRPQVTPQQRPQARPQPRQIQPRQSVQPQRSRQQATPPQRQIQRQQARPAPQPRVTPQRQQARPQIRQQARPQPRQQARPQVRQSVQRPQAQRSRPSIQQSRPQARPQVRQASSPRQQTRSSSHRSSSSQRRQSGRNRNN